MIDRIDRDVSFEVAEGEADRPIDGVLKHRLDVSWGRARELVARGKVSVDGVRIEDATTRVRRGAKVEVKPAARRVETHPRGTLADDAVVHLDTHVVVVRKAPGLSTVPYEDEEMATLEDQVQRWLVKKARQPPHLSIGVVHRIDKETSGLVVFARTFAAKKALSSAFRAHALERRYAAIVHGVLDRARTIESNIVADRGDGLRGRAKDERVGRAIGQHAVTHVTPIEVLSRSIAQDGASLVECRLETGRTHQIRIHLSEARHSLAGDRVYTRDRFKAGLPLIEAPRLMLHAKVLGFAHPITGAPLRFEDPIPEDMQRVIDRLRSKKG